MDLIQYKKYYVDDIGHWYLSKVKAYREDSVNEFAKGLRLFHDLLVETRDNQIKKQFLNFTKTSQKELFQRDVKQISITSKSKLFLALLILQNNLIDLSHLRTINKKKFDRLNEIKTDFVQGKSYDSLIRKYSKDFLTTDVEVHFRNFRSWLSKFGFFGTELTNSSFVTDIGHEFILSSRDSQASAAIFLHQIKKFQVWNPTIDQKYRSYRVLPYFILLDLLLSLSDNYFTRNEYLLFITKIKNHSRTSILQASELIEAFRKLSEKEQDLYIEQIIDLDKKRHPERKRPNFMRFSDSYSKEIAAYGFSGLVVPNFRDNENFVGLSNIGEARKEVAEFSETPGFIEFNEKYDWVNHLGKLDGLSLDEIVELYIRNGMLKEEIQQKLANEEGVKDIVEDVLLERQIEDHFERHFKHYFPDFRIVTTPFYGRQFPTSVGLIDILCKHVNEDRFAVIEFKRGQVSDDTIGQVLRYMGWVYINMSRTDSKVEGFVVGRGFSESFDYAIFGMQLDRDIVILRKHDFSTDNPPTDNRVAILE